MFRAGDQKINRGGPEHQTINQHLQRKHMRAAQTQLKCTVRGRGEGVPSTEKHKHAILNGLGETKDDFYS